MLKKLFEIYKRLRDWIPDWLIYAITIPLTLAICFQVMEIPTIISWGTPFMVSRKLIILNILTIGILWNLLMILSNRVWLSNLLCGTICGIIAIINYYVVTLHGMPLSFLLLRNFKTAMNVISNYKIEINRTVIKMLIALFVMVFMAVGTRLFSNCSETKASRIRILIRDCILVLESVLVVYFGYFGSNPVKPKKTIAWAWQEAYAPYGYTACTVETLVQVLSGIAEPDGYTEDAVEQISIEPARNDEAQTPDVILILNETFCDLSAIMDIQTDQPYLDGINNMDNLLTGYAIAAAAGGSTNNSEYEILTSNSTWLMPGATPFNILELKGASGVVSNLNSLGYYTLGSHSEEATNYSRLTGYQDLGFHDTYFWDDFQNKTCYADRHYPTDASLYENLIRWYEEAPENPRFLYLLTMQNHGSHHTSDDKYDLIHVTNDLGDYTSDANEYLTSVSLSDKAFEELTEYFATVDRPVIICMLGDHIAAFATNLVEGESQAETNLLQRTVPLLIWANFPLEEQDLGTMSMNYVVPTLLDIAGVQLSPYYSYLLQLKEQVPILTSYGDYYDAQGNRYTYDSDDGGPYQEAVDNYFYLEYESIQKERHQELFTPYGE